MQQHFYYAAVGVQQNIAECSALIHKVSFM